MLLTKVKGGLKGTAAAEPERKGQALLFGRQTGSCGSDQTDEGRRKVKGGAKQESGQQATLWA